MNFDFLSDYDFPTNVDGVFKKNFVPLASWLIKISVSKQNLFSDKVLGN